ncbi:MAG TPA: DUF3443 family protein [Terriglobales bacterium]|nr:DUF3443 family protein [Terriglobales bacterium]
MRKLRTLALFGALSLTLACGGGSGGSGGGGGGGGGGIPGCTNGAAATPSGNTLAASATNVATLVVDGGPPTLSASNNVYINGVFTTVTVCVPATPDVTCQDIDHVLVDTGSYGLRLLSNSGGGTLTAALSSALPPQKDTSGNSIAECAQFSDGITWGPVKMADIYIGGLTRMAGKSAKTVPGSGAAGMPVQIIGDPNFKTVPSACTAFGTPEDTLQTLLANGIIGVGPFPDDCGSACASTANNPGFYYACPSDVCTSNTQPTTQAETAQVWNPVAAFAKDNNGVILELPSVPAAGIPLVNGSLVFGIGTQSNNVLGKATVLMGDNSANITTTFAGTPSSNSFIDSGSNGYFFSSNIPTCTSSQGFYCPTSPLTCSATNSDLSGHSSNVNFNVVNADQLVAPNTAFDNIAGPNTPPAGSSGSAGFDWGLPFFYGRNVYTGLFPVGGVTVTPPGVPTGPFFAY